MPSSDISRSKDDILIVASGSLSATGRTPAESHAKALKLETGLRALTPDDIPNFDLIVQSKGLEVGTSVLDYDLFAGTAQHADSVAEESRSKTEAVRATFFANAWGNKCGAGGVIPREYFPDPKTYPKGFFKAGEQLVGFSTLQAYNAFEQIRSQLTRLFSADERKVHPDWARRTMIDDASGAGSSVEMMESALLEFIRAQNDGALGETFGKSGWLLGMLGNMGAGHLASIGGIEGPSCSSNAACASSGVAMLNGFNSIRAGQTDIAIVGGSENPIGPVNTYLSFDHMMKRKGGALSRNWRERRGAEHALTAYGADRDGFVPGNAAGLIVMMRRNVADVLKIRPIARVLGVSANTCQPRKFNKSLADGTITGQSALLENIFSSVGLEIAKIRQQLVHYLHATGTHAGAINELYAAAKALGLIAQDGRYAGTGTKEGIGHTLGPAFAMNMIEALEAMGGQVAGFPSTGQVDPVFQNVDPKILEKEENVSVDSPSLRAIADSIACQRNVTPEPDALWLATANGFGGANTAALMEREA